MADRERIARGITKYLSRYIIPNIQDCAVRILLGLVINEYGNIRVSIGRIPLLIESEKVIEFTSNDIENLKRCIEMS